MGTITYRLDNPIHTLEEEKKNLKVTIIRERYKYTLDSEITRFPEREMDKDIKMGLELTIPIYKPYTVNNTEVPPPGVTIKSSTTKKA